MGLPLALASGPLRQRLWGRDESCVAFEVVDMGRYDSCETRLRWFYSPPHDQ